MEQTTSLAHLIFILPLARSSRLRFPFFSFFYHSTFLIVKFFMLLVLMLIFIFIIILLFSLGGTITLSNGIRAHSGIQYSGCSLFFCWSGDGAHASMVDPFRS